MKNTPIFLILLIIFLFSDCSKNDQPYLKNNCNIAKATPGSLVTSTYDAFPLLVQTFNNNIKLYYRQGTAPTGNNGIIVARSSVDGGATFTQAATLLSEPNVDVRNVSGGITNTNRIILSVLKYDASKSISLSQGYIHSDDEGLTWSAYQTWPSNGHSFYSPYGKLITIGNDKIMQAWYGNGGVNNYSTYVITSSDNGATWSSSVQVATSSTIQYSEASYAYLDGGIIIGLVRNASGAVFHQVISLDNGDTWTDQGAVKFDEGAMVSPWLSTYRNASGEKYVVAYYANRTSNSLNAVTGTYAGLISGTSGWIDASLTKLGTNTSTNFGYPSVINPCGTKNVLGVYYKASSASVANLNFFTFDPFY